MYILYLVFLFSGSNMTPVVITGEYRSLAACEAASDTLQRAAAATKLRVYLATCTAKG